jgi:hypothetical protein
MMSMPHTSSRRGSGPTLNATISARNALWPVLSLPVGGAAVTAPGWLQPRPSARWLGRCPPGSAGSAAGRVGVLFLRTKPSTTTPHARGRGGITRGSSASQPPVVFRLYPPRVVGAGSGRVPGPKFAAGTAAGAAGGFLGHREGQKSVGFCPLGGAHQSAWSLFIHCARPCIHRAEGVRRVRNCDFWKCVQKFAEGTC